MRRFIIIAILLSAGSVSTYAQGDGGFAGTFLRMGLGARGISMGSAQVAVADDGFAAYYNPAGLPFLKGRRFSTSYAFMPLDRQFHFISLATNLKPTAGLSLYWIGAGTDNIDGRDFSGNYTGDMSDRTNAFSLAFANRFHPKLSVGASLKIIKQDLDLAGESVGASDLAFDFGVMTKPMKNLSIGLLLKDFQGGLSWNTQDIFTHGSTTVDSIPYVVIVGTAYYLGEGLLLSGAVEFNEMQEERVHFGAEYLHEETYSLRLGIEDADAAFGAGMFFELKEGLATSLDYAFRLGRAGEGATHIFSWTFEF